MVAATTKDLDSKQYSKYYKFNTAIYIPVQKVGAT
jgi:hypothetical protein